MDDARRAAHLRALNSEAHVEEDMPTGANPVLGNAMQAAIVARENAEQDGSITWKHVLREHYYATIGASSDEAFLVELAGLRAVIELCIKEHLGTSEMTPRITINQITPGPTGSLPPGLPPLEAVRQSRLGRRD